MAPDGAHDHAQIYQKSESQKKMCDALQNWVYSKTCQMIIILPCFFFRLHYFSFDVSKFLKMPEKYLAIKSEYNQP